MFSKRLIIADIFNSIQQYLQHETQTKYKEHDIEELWGDDERSKRHKTKLDKHKQHTLFMKRVNGNIFTL